jgi:hypothetical protein
MRKYNAHIMVALKITKHDTKTANGLAITQVKELIERYLKNSPKTALLPWSKQYMTEHPAITQASNIPEKISEFKVLFPEFSHLKIIPVLGSLRFDEKFIPLATANNIFLMGFREWEYMDLINFQELTGKPGPNYKGDN